MDAYVATAMSTMMKGGGTVLVADDSPELLEGQWHGNRTVILGFESVEAARAWYRSPEYQAVIPIRQDAADANVVIVAGFEPPGG
jgi:uncharacterized protein (DUF1330 family)